MIGQDYPESDQWYDPTDDTVHGAPVDGTRVLDNVHAFLRAYVAFPSTAASVAVTLWAAHTHLVGKFDSTPRLALLSPEKQCGKTRVLELIELLCAGCERLNDASAAYIFRRIGAGQVTILMDEADTLWKRGKGDDAAEALRNIINSGHRKGSFVGRVEMNGQAAELKRFFVYAPVALAGIGNCLPDTILDRSVIVAMRRRAPDEQVRDYRERVTRPEGEALREQLAQWADAVADKVGYPWPEMPPGVNDRPADVWEPLLMVAELAGGEWPERAWQACAAFVAGAKGDTASVGTRLLADLYEVFGDAGVMSTETILARLRGIEEAPWADWYGKPFNARALAKMLKSYSTASGTPVKSGTVRIGDETAKGYRREDLHDAWSRYGVLPGVSDTSVTSVTPLARHVTDVTGVTHTPGREEQQLWPSDSSATAPSADDASTAATESGSSSTMGASSPAFGASPTDTTKSKPCDRCGQITDTRINSAGQRLCRAGCAA